VRWREHAKLGTFRLEDSHFYNRRLCKKRGEEALGPREKTRGLNDGRSLSPRTGSWGRNGVSGANDVAKRGGWSKHSAKGGSEGENQREKKKIPRTEAPTKILKQRG